MEGTLCLTTGIPAAGLVGTSCTDPPEMVVDVRELAMQTYTAELVQGTLTDPNISNPFEPCSPASAAQIQVQPTEISRQDGATFTITQETADFVYGQNAHAPPICSVAITDSHNQQILVNIGIQISVDCANISCTAGRSVATSPALARRRRIGG